MRIAAIVLNYHTPALTLRALASLKDSVREIDDLFIVDNDPTTADRAALAAEQRVTYLATEKNLGFSGGMNRGVRAALARAADAVLLVNSDAMLAPDCAGLLADAMRQPRVGVVGPVLRSSLNPSVVTSSGIRYAPASGRMRNLETVTGDDTRDVDAINGCVMLVARGVFEAVGLLDEAYFYGFEDIDLCLRAREAGYRCVLAPLAASYHDGSRSIGHDSPQRFYFAARNHLRLAAREGSDPARGASVWRFLSVVSLNVAHALVAPGAPLPARLGAVIAGTRDYCRGRFGNASV